MKIYTRTGDLGETDLLGGSRISKASHRMEACGTVDELNAILGLARAEEPQKELDELLERIQNELFLVGAELVTPNNCTKSVPRVTPHQIELLEKAIDRHEASLPPLRHFILPGGTRLAATLHQARTVSRRAERRIVALAQSDDSKVWSVLLSYFNRLSDLLFVLTHVANQADVTRRDT